MNFIEGVTLKEKLDAYGSFALNDAIPILRQLANALDYAHSKGILHRDLKPENVMLTKINGDEQAILMDFGLVKAIETSLALTQDNSILGTPTYMAPERISSEKANERNPASDRYSLGIITFYMLTGQLPFTGEPLQVMYAHQYHSIPNAKLTSAGLQKSTIDALLRMLAKRPEERFDTCIEFLKELEDAPARLTNYKSIRLKHIVGVLFAFVGIQTFLVFMIRQSDLFQPHGDENTPTSNANAIQDKETQYLS